EAKTGYEIGNFPQPDPRRFWTIEHCNCSMVVERRSSLTIIGKIHSELAFRPRGLRRPTIWSRLSASLCNRGITQPFYPARITPLASGWWKSTICEKSVSSALTNVSTRGFVGTDQKRDDWRLHYRR